MGWVCFHLKIEASLGTMGVTDTLRGGHWQRDVGEHSPEPRNDAVLRLSQSEVDSLPVAVTASCLRVSQA